ARVGPAAAASATEHAAAPQPEDDEHEEDDAQHDPRAGRQVHRHPLADDDGADQDRRQYPHQDEERDADQVVAIGEHGDYCPVAATCWLMTAWATLTTLLVGSPAG